MYQAARDAYLESEVLSASPLGLVRLLYDEALGAVRDARHHLEKGATMERSRAISKACTILAELAASLNRPGGGELAERLAALYDYMQRKLIEANFQRSEAPLGEVQGLLSTLAEAWATISRAEQPSAGRQETPPQANVWSAPQSRSGYSVAAWSR